MSKSLYGNSNGTHSLHSLTHFSHAIPYQSIGWVNESHTKTEYIHRVRDGWAPIDCNTRIENHKWKKTNISRSSQSTLCRFAVSLFDTRKPLQKLFRVEFAKEHDNTISINILWIERVSFGGSFARQLSLSRSFTPSRCKRPAEERQHSWGGTLMKQSNHFMAFFFLFSPLFCFSYHCYVCCL